MLTQAFGSAPTVAVRATPEGTDAFRPGTDYSWSGFTYSHLDNPAVRPDAFNVEVKATTPLVGSVAISSATGTSVGDSVAEYGTCPGFGDPLLSDASSKRTGCGGTVSIGDLDTLGDVGYLSFALTAEVATGRVVEIFAPVTNYSA